MDAEPVIALYLIAGAGLGLLYFAGLWRSARRLASGAPVAPILGLRLLGFALLAGLLTLAVRLDGRAALLAASAGLWLARLAVMRRVAR